jgi:hypothetical protein
VSHFQWLRKLFLSIIPQFHFQWNSCNYLLGLLLFEVDNSSVLEEITKLDDSQSKRRMPMDKDFMLNYYDKMVRPTWTELMKTPRYQRAACERDKIEREFRRLLDEKLGRKYLELDDALFRVMDDIAEAMYMKGAADRELMIR